MQVLQQWLFGIVQVHNKSMNTPSMIISPSIILLQPHVGRFHASDLPQILIFCRLVRQCLTNKWGCCIMQVLQQWLFGIVWVYNKLINTLSMIISPPTILLQPLVGRFHASDQAKIRIFYTDTDGQAMFGHQVGVWHHVGAAIVVVWHCMGV